MSKISVILEQVNSRDDNDDYNSSSSSISRLRDLDNSYFSRPGLSQSVWVNDHLVGERIPADSGRIGDNSVTLAIGGTQMKETTEGSHYAMNSRNQHVDFSLARQAGKVVATNADPLQSSKNSVRMAPPTCNEHLSAHRSDPSASEPSLLPQQEPLSRSARFVTLAPFFSRMETDSRVENESLPHLQPNQMTAHAFSSPPGTRKHLGSAQLSIFYAGMVNVYDDVTIEKAQAIMLLAGTSRAWASSNHTNLPGASGHPPLASINQPSFRSESPAPQMISSHAGTTALSGVPKGTNRQVPTAATGLIVELPQARKASLARFLEKRKDRVRKGPYKDLRNEILARNDESRTSREYSLCPSDSKGKAPALSLSPPAARNRSDSIFPSDPGHAGSASASTNEPTSRDPLE